MRRREFITLLGGVVVGWSLPGHAQRAIPVVGWLHSLSAHQSALVVTAFSEGLRGAGYVEGQNVVIEYQWADGQYERLAELATALTRRKDASFSAHTGPQGVR